MLEIQNLHVTVAGKQILKGLDLKIAAGEVHAMMGPNGSGKSTLSYVLAGREGYEVTDGAILYQGKNLLELSTEERAREGIFLAFQYPVEIPGVGSNNFLKSALNAIRKHSGLPTAVQSGCVCQQKRDATLAKKHRRHAHATRRREHVSAS